MNALAGRENGHSNLAAWRPPELDRMPVNAQTAKWTPTIGNGKWRQRHQSVGRATFNASQRSASPLTGPACHIDNVGCRRCG